MKRTLLVAAFTAAALAFLGCASTQKATGSKNGTENEGTKPSPMNGGASWQPGDAMAPTAESSQ